MITGFPYLIIKSLIYKTMKKLLFIAVLFSCIAAHSQLMTKHVKSYTFQNGLAVTEGMKIELIHGSSKSPGDYIWVYEGGTLIVPKAYCDQRFDGKVFEITRVMSMKGIEKEKSIIVEFEVDKVKYYAFAAQAVETGEAKFY